nr:sugar transferase [uncultured Cetobacterium sp.]
MLRILYMGILGVIFYMTSNVLLLTSQMKLIGIGIFMLILLSMYIFDLMNFDAPSYSLNNYLTILIIDTIFFGAWFVYSLEYWLLIFLISFYAFTILLRYLMNRTFYKEKFVTIYGEGVLRKNLEESLKLSDEYNYIPYDGKISDLEEFVRENNIRILLLGKLQLKDIEIEKILKIKLKDTEVKGYLDYMLDVEKKIDVAHINKEWLLEAYGFQILRSKVQNKIKRVFDIMMSLTIGILTLPVMIIAAIIVKLESPGPIIYSQSRVGENEKEFLVHKFRSMRQDAEKNGAVWAQKNDPRVTKFGSFMRKTRIDELPQIINVLKGDMSFIGPRPERMVFIKELEKQIPFYGLRHMVKPGLTGWAQVMYPYGATVEDAQNKLEYDLYYIKAYSLYLDIIILFKTLKTVVFGKGR